MIFIFIFGFIFIVIFIFILDLFLYLFLDLFLELFLELFYFYFVSFNFDIIRGRGLSKLSEEVIGMREEVMKIIKIKSLC